MLNLQGVRIYESHVNALITPNVWLPDPIINGFLTILPTPASVILDSGILTKLREKNEKHLTKWVGKNIERISKCERLYQPLHIGIHWALGVFEVKLSTLFIFDSLPPRYAFWMERDLLRKIPHAIYDELEDKGDGKGDWKRDWKIVSQPDNVLNQKNSDDCGVYLCIHATLYEKTAKESGSIRAVVNHSPETWRNLLHECLIQNSFAPFERAFLSDEPL